MNLKAVAEQFSSITSRFGGDISNSLQTVWELLNYDLVDNIFAPRRRVFIALDKDSISVAYGSRFMGKSKIHACRKYAYERKVQENVIRRYSYQDGQLPKPEVVASTLDYFVGEFKAQHAKIILSIPKAWTIYRTVEFPSTVLENIHDVISYELDRLMSLNADNAYYDYKVVGKNEDHLTVAIAAARKDLIDSYIRPIEENGLTVEKVTTSLSVAGGLLRLFYGKQCFVLLEAYKDEYEVSAIRESVVLHAHKEKFSSENKSARISLLSEDLTSVCKNLNQTESSVQMVVCSDDEGYESLREIMDMPVHIIRKSNVFLDYKGENREADFLSASGCMELLAGNQESVNLISQKNKIFSSQAYRFSILLAVAAVLFGVSSLFAPLILEKVKILAIDNQLEILKDDFRKNEPQKNELDTILYQIRATNEFKNSTPPKILLLRELSDIIPSPFWISKMAISENTMAIEIRGKGLQGEVVPLLEASPYFENVRRVDPGESGGGSDMATELNVFQMDIVNKPAEREKRK